MERITPRYVFEARIRIRVQRGSQNAAMEGWARDLSETGVSAFVAQVLTVGELVTLEIPLAASQWHSIPAKVARCVGTQYGFQFIALSPNQRENVRFAVRNHPEIGAYGRSAETTPPEQKREANDRRSTPQPETPREADTGFADRARLLVKRGYTPKVAVELVLHEIKFEQGNDSKAMEKARADADDFLKRASHGLI
ncbi:MAG TPA: PilZ domain-containing protein [Candidatus Sulfotelmatobacter sp.]|nr:PilZ domain-containing protein [Candidatus Sulfotelmatobacter sp.]